MAHTLLLELPENIYRSLVRTAKRAGQSPEAWATDQLVETQRQRQAEDPIEEFIGAFSSSEKDWADRHDEYLGQAARAKMQRGTKNS